MPKKRNNRPDVDGLLPEVDEEMQGGASDAKSHKSSSRDDDMSSGEPDDTETSRHSDKSTLAQKLEVFMEGPESPYGTDLPELQARANGYLSSEVEEALQQATSVLKNQFDGVSKSLIMNYAIRLVLWELRENAEKSQLVEWLKEVANDKK